jgi:hypothetical protein
MAVKAAAGRALVWGRSGLEIGARRSGGEVVGGGDSGAPLVGLEGERGRQTMEGNGRRWWCAMMVVEVAVLGGDRLGWWWGVMRGGGVLRPFWEQKGGRREAVHTRACEAAVAASVVRSGRKTTGRGPRVGERGWGGLAGLAQGRGPVVGGGGGPMGGERGVG